MGLDSGIAYLESFVQDHCGGEQETMTMHKTSQVSSIKTGRLQWCRPAVGVMRSKDYQMDAHFRSGSSSGSWLALIICKNDGLCHAHDWSPPTFVLSSPSILQTGLLGFEKHLCPPFLQGYLIRRFSAPFTAFSALEKNKPPIISYLH